MNIYDTIIDLMRKMTSEELTLLKAHLSAYDRRGEKYTGKALPFFNLVTEHEFNMKMKEVSHALYPQGNEGSFLRFMLRFREKMEETFLLDANISRDAVYSKRQQLLIATQKELALARIYIYRNELAQAFRCIKIAVEKANQTEAFSELLLGLDMLADIPAVFKTGGLANHKKQYSRVKKQKETFDSLQQLWRVLMQTWDKPNTNPQLKEQVQTLSLLNSSCSSKNAGVYLNLCKAYIELSENNPRDAVRLLRSNYVELINNHYVFQPALVVENGLKLMEVLLNMYRFTLLVETGYILLSLPNFTGDAQIQVMEMLFLAYLHQRNYQQAEVQITDLLKMAATSKASIFKYRFWLAQLLILKGFYAEGTDLIKEILPMPGLVHELDFQLRWAYLVGVTLYNKEMEKEPMYKLQTSVKKVLSSEPVTKRDEAIQDILRALFANNFDFKAVFFQLQDKINELASYKTPVAWQHTTSELLRFNAWYDTMRNNIPFEIPVPRYESPENRLIIGVTDI